MQPLAAIDSDAVSSADRKASAQVLVIYDGGDLGGYDPYLNLNFMDGVFRRKIVQLTQPTYAVDAKSLEDALSIIDSIAIQSGSLDRIAIVDHGDIEKYPPTQTLGDEPLKPRDFKKLRRLLKPDGDICLYGCQVGRNVSYLKRISRQLEGRKVWAYAGAVRYDREDPQPLPDPDENMFFYYPLYQ